MFKHFNSIKMIIAMVMGLVIVASCEKEKQESKETTVTLEQVSVGLTSVKFSVTSTNALSAAYVIYPSLAMSANIPFRYRLISREGVVTDVIENSRGFYVTAEFDEPEVDMTK